MTDSAKLEQERLSAFVDGELPPGEQSAFAGRLSEVSELRAQLRRYQQIGQALQASKPPHVDAAGVAESVSRALADEPTLLAPPRRSGFSLSRVALGGALAAGVAVLAIAVAPVLVNDEPGADSHPQTFAFAPNPSIPPFPVTAAALGDKLAVENRPAPQRWLTLKPELQRRLDNYLIEHSEYAGHYAVAPANAHVGFISTDDD